ncbi:hypothetical protein V8E51_008940, partial [Hyaloscypha variabilis]
MTLPLSKAFLIISVGLLSIASSSTTNTASSDEGYRITRNSTAYRYGHYIGQVRPAEGELTSSDAGSYGGHRYAPGQNRPVVTRTSEPTTESTLYSNTVKARQKTSPLIYPSYAPFVHDLNATATTLTTRTVAHPFTPSVVYTFPSVSVAAASSTPAYQSVTIDGTQQSSSGTPISSTGGLTSTEVTTTGISTSTLLMSTITIENSPATQSSPLTTFFGSVTATGISSDLEPPAASPWTLPPCNGPSPGPGLTPLGCTFVNSEPTRLPTTTYSWSEIASITATSKPTASIPLTPSWPGSNQSQSWTSGSIPCPGNETFECVINGTSTITLGLISQILGLGSATAAPDPTPPPGAGNLPQGWANNLAPCADNTTLECLVIASSTTTLGPIAQTAGLEPTSTTPIPPPGNVNLSQSWTSNSTPCADNKSWECVDTPSGVVSLAPISSLKYAEVSTSNTTPCANNKSLECVVDGTSTITLGMLSSPTAFHSSGTTDLSTDTGLLSTIISDLGLLTTSSTTSSSFVASAGIMTTTYVGHSSTVISSSTTSGSTATTSVSIPPPSPTPCASDASMECLVDGNSTFTAEPTQKTLSKTPSDAATVTATTKTSLPSKSSGSTPALHNPYPYPSAQSRSIRRFKVPTFFMLFCSLFSMAISIDVRSIHPLANKSAASTSTDVSYAPLVSSIASMLTAISGEPDGDWGTGVQPAATSTSPQNGEYGGGGQANTPAATSTFAQNSQYGGGGQINSPTTTTPTSTSFQTSGGGDQSKSPSATPASSTITHAAIFASSSFSPFPTNFIQPITEAAMGSASETSHTKSPSPASSPIAKSGSSKLKAPLLVLLFFSLVSLGAATINPQAIPLTTQILSSSTASGPSEFLSTPVPCPSNPDFDCVVQGGGALTLGTILPQPTGSYPLLASPSPCTSNPNDECIVQGVNTFIVGSMLWQSTLTMVSTAQATSSSTPTPAAPSSATMGTLLPQSTLTTAPRTQTTAPATTSKSVKSGAFKVRIPFVLLLLCSFLSLVTSSFAPYPRGVNFSSNANPIFSTWVLSDISAAPTASATVSTAAYPTGISFSSNANPRFSSWNLSALPAPPTTTVAAATTNLMSSSSVPSSVETISPSTTLQTSSSATTAAPSKTATSGSSRVKSPSLFVLLSSLASRSMAQLGRDTTNLTPPVTPHGGSALRQGDNPIATGTLSQQPTLTSVPAIHLGSPIIVATN